MRSDLSFNIIRPGDNNVIELITGWYFDQWKMDRSKATVKLQAIVADPKQFHMIAKLGEEIVATGGYHHHVSLINYEPRFNLCKDWLALVCTAPHHRNHGYGAQLCNAIEREAIRRGVSQMMLFTEKAERLYKRLGWKLVEGNVAMGERRMVVMTKAISTT